MLVAHVLPLVQSLKSRKWSDDEIVDDIQFLHEELKKSFDGMTCVLARLSLPRCFR